MNDGHRRGRDTGASFYEYVALLGIVAGVAAVALTGLPTAVTDSVARSICKIFSLDPCPWQPHPRNPRRRRCRATPRR
ncbi:hypothetical protein Acsp03_63930 [Actinomadura sp. NBRC 104412]|nr:hypothetical protein Acsp03_63930 [Actinomadura sp. NBRC 104412]